MRALTFEEMRSLLCKIIKYKKDHLLLLIQEEREKQIVFRIQKSRIFEAFLGLTRQSECFREHHLASSGVCIARHTHSNRLFLMIPCIKMITSHPVSKTLGLTRSGETLFLRGFHLTHASFAWAAANIVRGEGVSVEGPTGLILGFGEVIDMLSSSQKIHNYKKVVMVNHGDIGSYTRIH